MTFRNLLLAACAGTGLLIAYGSMATPLFSFGDAEDKPYILVNSDEDDDDDDDRKFGERDDDDDDDDDDCGRGGVTRPQGATPPANGLFAPGSKPAVQIN